MLSKPVIGAARGGDACRKTVDVFLEGIRRVADLHGERLLDVGCGTGTFTFEVGRRFSEVHGVDVQPDYINSFREDAPGPKYTAHLVSAASLPFADAYFDTVISLETLEHVEALPPVAAECARVCKPGGQLVLTVPNRWYPIEGHGARILGKEFSRFPIITYIPWLHGRVGKARVFTVRSLDRLFCPLGFRREALSYLWPTFEHGGMGMQQFFQRTLRWTFPFMRKMEMGPLRMFGSSIVARYQKI